MARYTGSVSRGSCNRLATSDCGGKAFTAPRPIERSIRRVGVRLRFAHVLGSPYGRQNLDKNIKQNIFAQVPLLSWLKHHLFVAMFSACSLSPFFERPRFARDEAFFVFPRSGVFGRSGCLWAGCSVGLASLAPPTPHARHETWVLQDVRAEAQACHWFC